MRAHLPAPDHGRMDPAPAPYLIRIDGHLGATMLSAFPALAPRQHDAHTVLTGLPDRSALYGVLAAIDTRLSGRTNRARTGIGATATSSCSNSRVPRRHRRSRDRSGRTSASTSPRCRAGPRARR